MKSIYDLLIEWNDSNPEFIFLKYKKSYSISDVIFEVESISQSLSFIPDQQIGIYLSSKLDFILLYLACINSNKIPIIFKNTWGSDEINFLINKYNIDHIICDWDGKKLFRRNTTLYFFEELVNSSRGCGIPRDSKSIEKFESVVFTSGSTGFPRGVCLKRKNFYYSSLYWNKEIRFDSIDRYALCLPLYHIAGLSILYRSIYNKLGINLLDNYREINLISSSIISLVPSILDKLITQNKYHKSLQSYKAIILGGELANQDLLEKCIELKLNIFISYGMTETCSGISGFWLNNHIDKLSSAGKPFSNVDISINNNNNVSIASDMNMMGYYQETKSEQPFISSDIGELKNGFLYIVGRSDDIVVCRGEKINLNYIKNILLEHDDINSAKVNMRTNKKNEDFIEANIIINNHKVDEDVVKEWCQKKIGKYKTPKEINVKKV